MRALLPVLTNQSTIIFIFFWACRARRLERTRVRQRHKSGRRLGAQPGVNPDYLQLNQAASRGVGDGFGAADDIHLREDCLQMRFHSAFTNIESLFPALCCFLRDRAKRGGKFIDHRGFHAETVPLHNPASGAAIQASVQNTRCRKICTRNATDGL